MKKVICIMAIFLATWATYAQTSVSLLNGKLTDRNTKTALEYITVSVHRQDSSIVAGATTGENGEFSIKDVPFGEYFLVASFMGYKEVRQELNIETEVLEIPIIEMVEDVQALNAAVVTQRRPIIEQKLDMLIMNVSEAISTQGSDGMEVLRRAPGVSVDPDGNITLNGSRVDIWIDGRPSYLSGKDLEALLLSTDAGTIDRIEIMAHPSAKYDAAGGGGIINVITKRNFMKGFNGSLSGSYGGMYFDRYLQSGSGTVNLGYRSEKSNTFFTYSPRIERTAANLKSNLLLGENYNMQQLSSSDYIFENKSHSLKLGNDWFIDKKNTFGVIVNSIIRGSDQYNYKPVYTNTYIDGALATRQVSQIENSNTFDNISANLNYTHIFDQRKGREITLNADYGYYDLIDGSRQENVFIDPETAALFPNPDIFRYNSNQQIDIISAKADYQQYFWKTGMLEIGGKWAMTRTDNNTLREDFSNDNWIENGGLSNEFKYDEQISALYVSASKMFNPKWTAKVGIRAEHTYAVGSWISADKNTDKSYIDFFPTVYVGYTPSKNWRHSLSYTMRINRPTFNQLNPFRTYIDANTWMEGNPDINPQFIDQLALTVGFKSYLNVTALYAHTRDFIVQEPILNNTESKLLIWGNFGTLNMTGLSISVSELPIFKWLIFNANAFGAYNTNTAIKENGDIYRNNGFMSSAYGNLSFLLPQDWKIEFGCSAYGSIPWGYFLIDPQVNFFGGIKKTLLDNKATLTLNVKDIFRTQKSDLRMKDDNGIEYYSLNQRLNNQKVTVSFTYRFGNVKATKKRKVGTQEEASRVGGSSGIGK